MSRRGKILDSIPCHGCEKGDNPEKRKIVLVNITRPPYAKGLYERTDIEYHCGLGKKYDNCSLAPRETEILKYIAQGYLNKQIAAELGISEQTIKNHVTSILRN